MYYLKLHFSGLDWSFLNRLVIRVQLKWNHQLSEIILDIEAIKPIEGCYNLKKKLKDVHSFVITPCPV